jgi:hypothetical protein
MLHRHKVPFSRFELVLEVQSRALKQQPSSP